MSFTTVTIARQNKGLRVAGVLSKESIVDPDAVVSHKNGKTALYYGILNNRERSWKFILTYITHLPRSHGRLLSF